MNSECVPHNAAFHCECSHNISVNTSWLQAFTLGAPEYGAEQLRQQKRAVYDAGYDGWVMWNPGSKYQVYLPALEKTLVSRKKVY